MSSTPTNDKATNAAGNRATYEAVDGVPGKEPTDEVFNISDRRGWPVDELRVTGCLTGP